MINYDFHPETLLDLDEIWELIRVDNLDAADRVIAEIVAAIDAVVPFPARGHRRPDLTSRPLRFILVREYLIAYAPDEKPLWVVAVMHGRRSPRVMAAILEVGSKFPSFPRLSPDALSTRPRMLPTARTTLAIRPTNPRRIERLAREIVGERDERLAFDDLIPCRV